MVYEHRAPNGWNPLTSDEQARLETLAGKKTRSGWEEGETWALYLRAPWDVQERLRLSMTPRPVKPTRAVS